MYVIRGSGYVEEVLMLKSDHGLANARSVLAFAIGSSEDLGNT